MFESWLNAVWGSLIGVMANQILMVAGAWHMYGITSSAWDLGLATVVFGPVGSVALAPCRSRLRVCGCFPRDRMV
ncbi:hypothetical protein [Rhodoferax sp. UBA5149]|uniref:hypothetical protein n=1 Tax=Rhodoferax sp. UBA5149 TaxID=1947379 RepID=UPI0025EA1AE1|nr:hypothetical protein [Rhodoferax sp. UBA5149]